MNAGTVQIVPGTSDAGTGTVVLAAVEDDPGCAQVLQYAQDQARRLGVRLRVVHVWASRERMTDSDRLLTDLLYDNLPPEEAEAVERQILHDDDPALALAALSREAALLVVAEGALGETVRRLAGRTACPLAIAGSSSRAAEPVGQLGGQGRGVTRKTG